MGLTRLDEAPGFEVALGHLQGRWTDLGRAAGSLRVGLRRIEVPAGGWSTPAHEHGRAEEIFYVLAGRGLSWQAGRTTEIGAGDCIVYLAGRGAHTLHGVEPLDVLAFGPREATEVLHFPRLGMSRTGGRAFESVPGAIEGAPVQFAREAEIGPPELPTPTERPPTVVNLADVEGKRTERTRIVRTRRDLGRAAGSVQTGIKHIEVAPGKESVPLHCHSHEEEIFVVLDGGGVFVHGGQETPVERGHVVAQRAGTGEAHLFRAGAAGLTFLAYGPRDPGDLCYYPRSQKISFGGLHVIARVQPLDYWDGED